MEINRYHELKTIQPFFNQVVKGEKHFELRKHDRDYQVGDFLLLVEYGEGIMFPTVPQSFLVKITSMVSSEFGLKDGYCALSIETDLFFRNHYNVLETKKKRKGVLDYSHNVDVFLDDIAGRYVGVDFEELKNTRSIWSRDLTYLGVNAPDFSKSHLEYWVKVEESKLQDV